MNKEEILRREGDERYRNWHKSKSINIPTLVLLIVQIGGIVYWGATLKANEQAHYKEMVTRTEGIITESTADAKFEKRDLAIEHNGKAIERIYRIQEKMDDKLDKILEKLK